MSIAGIQTNLVIASVSVAAGQSSASFPHAGLDLDANNVQGNFGAQVVITGDGTATIGFECSADGSTWIKPSDPIVPGTALTIASGLTKTGGPGGDGKFYFPVEELPTSKYIRFYATETGGANAVVVALTIVFQ